MFLLQKTTPLPRCFLMVFPHSGLRESNMGPTQTARCQTCQAIVNPVWKTCAACQSPLTSSGVVIEPAHPNVRPVYWERNNGVIYGPATVTDLAQVGTGGIEQLWVVIESHGQLAWVRSDRLRSKQAFERQVTPKPFLVGHIHSCWAPLQKLTDAVSVSSWLQSGLSKESVR